MPGVLEAAENLPKPKYLLDVYQSGEICRRWKDANIIDDPRSATEVKSYYIKNLDTKYRLPSKYWAHLLTFNLEKQGTIASPEARKEVRMKFQNVLKTAKINIQAGSSFLQVKEKLESDTVLIQFTELSNKKASQGGRLFESQFYKAEVGKVFGPVKSKSTALIFQIDEKQLGEPIPFIQVKDEIAQMLARQSLKHQWDVMLEQGHP